MIREISSAAVFASYLEWIMIIGSGFSLSDLVALCEWVLALSLFGHIGLYVILLSIFSVFSFVVDLTGVELEPIKVIVVRDLIKAVVAYVCVMLVCLVIYSLFSPMA